MILIGIGATFIAFGGLFYGIPFLSELPGIFALIGLILCVVGFAGQLFAYLAYESTPPG